MGCTLLLKPRTRLIIKIKLGTLKPAIFLEGFFGWVVMPECLVNTLEDSQN